MCGLDLGRITARFYIVGLHAPCRCEHRHRVEDSGAREEVSDADGTAVVVKNCHAERRRR
jgi:hypothetical protein